MSLTNSRVLLLALGAVSLAGCRGITSKDEPVVGIRNMYDQPRYNVQSESEFFADKRTMRPLVEGTISRQKEISTEIASGRTEDNCGYVPTVPSAVSKEFASGDALVARGQERFGIYCAPCHDNTGSGNGLVRKRAVAAGAAAFVPPTFHQDRIRHMPDGQLYATIANGKGNMPAYPQISINDRWAIVSYVRALQVSQAKTESNL